MNADILPPKLVASAKGPPIDPSYRINIHFQPDLLFQDYTVIESLALTKQYCSQFETGISNGGLLATSGRLSWETELFGDFYAAAVAADRAKLQSRPKYGAVNVTNDPYGAAPRFGSCYFRLKAGVMQRSTFCFPDSYCDVQAVGTAQHFELENLALAANMADPLDWPIEAHVHGPLVIPEDIEALVLDPSYMYTFVQTAAEQLGCAIEYHPGYRVAAKDLQPHESYRGHEYVEIAQKLADHEGMLTPVVVGKAYRQSGFGQQQIKKVWHYLARYGRIWEVNLSGTINIAAS